MIELNHEQQVAKDYAAALDSVALINAGKPSDWKGTDAEWADVITRNKEHLQIQVAKGAAYYGSNDLTPFTEAINK